MSYRLKCHCCQEQFSYEIDIQNGQLFQEEGVLKYLITLGSRFAIVTDDNIAELYGKKMLKILSENDLEAILLSFPAGEQFKTRKTKEFLEDQMFAKGLGRDTVLIALGGGVVTDMGGYIAATYCRGIPLVMIPTSLLGMVDASIGGKTGIDVPYGKNLIGAIYQPKRVVIDPNVLKTLPNRELRNGIVEMIKHGLIIDRKYFEYLEEHAADLLAFKSPILENAIRESCLIKKNIVEEDEKENGKRRLLNFGHTIGHALEHATGYEIPHGEAVALGIMAEAYIARQLGELDEDSFNRIWSILEKYGVPTRLSVELDVQTILDGMTLDKKSLNGLPRFVIINAIGQAGNYGSNYCAQVDEKLIRKALNWLLHDLRRH